MGQLNEAIEVKNVLDFYGIKNFVETGTGIAEVVRAVHDVDSSLTIHTIEVVPEIYDQKYWRPWNNRKHKHAFVPEVIVDFMEENGYTNIFSSQRDLNHSFIVVGEKH